MGPLVWLVDGIPVEHDGSQFDISDVDSSLTLLGVSQSRCTNKETVFQCCVKLTSGPQVCGERYQFDALGELCVDMSNSLNPLHLILHTCFVTDWHADNL